METEIYPLDIDVAVPLQPFNAPGTEVAARSYEVGEYFQSDWFAHDVDVIITVAAVIEAVNKLESSVFHSLQHRKEGWPSD